MNRPPKHITDLADTFEDRQFLQDAMDIVDRFYEQDNFPSLRKLDEYISEKLPRKDAA